MTSRRPRSAAPRAGQAVLELAVGLFALLAAIVAVLCAGLFATADGDAMTAAQRDAFERAASGAAAPEALSAGDGDAASGTGLHRGEGEAVADLPPAAAPLFGLGGKTTVRHEAWMPSTGGIP